MNILILGGGGREHALAWAVLQNPKCDKLIVAPGNAGIAEIADCATFDINDGAAVVEFSEAEAIDLVIVGPEAPLAAGVADDLRAAGFAGLRPLERGRPAGSLETLHQGNLRRRQGPDGGLGANSPKPPPPRPTCANRAPPSSSRPMAWPPARA